MSESAPRAPAPSVAPRAESIEDILHLVRTRVLLVALNILAIAMPIVCVALAWQAFVTGALTPTTSALCSWGIVFPLLRLFHSRIRFRTAALLLMTVLLLSAAMVAVRGGLTIGNLAVSVLLIMMSTLFFGRPGAIAALVAIILVNVTSGVLVVEGFVPPMAREMWDPLNGAVWVRQTFIMTLLGVVMAVTELYVVERLAHQVDVHQKLAAREREQRLALEQSERERVREREQREQREGGPPSTPETDPT